MKHAPRHEPAESEHGLVDTVRNLTLLLLPFAVIGFTHKFANMQALGVEIELGQEPAAQFAVDSLRSILDYWWMYGSLALATAALVVLSVESERRNWLPLKAKRLTAGVLCASLLTMVWISFNAGRSEAEDLLSLNFAGSRSTHYQQILMPPESSSRDAAQCFTWSAPTPKGLKAAPNEPNFLIAETADSFHVVQISAPDPGQQGGPTAPVARPVVFLKNMVPCYRRLVPGVALSSPLTGPSQTPAADMPPTPRPKPSAHVPVRPTRVRALVYQTRPGPASRCLRTYLRSV